MKPVNLWLFLLILTLAACSAGGSENLPTSQLPNPSQYALVASDLPAVGVEWGQTYNQTTEEPGYKWSYQAYQAYQPSSSANELDSAYAVNNDVYLYSADMRKAALPQPPSDLGNISGVKWSLANQLHTVGDKSAVWKTTLGDLFTPVWWLEFYKGHAYVRISLFGFPDQIAPSIIYGLADIVAGRLPSTTDELRSDAASLPTTQLPAGSAIPTKNLPVAPATAEP